MAGVAQSVERQIVALEVASSKLVARPTNFYCACFPCFLGCRQAVRHGILIPAFVGSNPATPATTYGPLAQSAEHVTFNHGVPGSNLGWITRKKRGKPRYI